MWKFIAPFVLVFLAACGGPRGTSDPVVASYYGSSSASEAVQVQVQIPRATDPTTAHARTQITANQVCGRRNQRAEYAMRREMMNENWEDVYTCR